MKRKTSVTKDLPNDVKGFLRITQENISGEMTMETKDILGISFWRPSSSNSWLGPLLSNYYYYNVLECSLL